MGGPTVAVETISLKIPAGTYCCLLGPSGCGKTTTLRMIAGHEDITDGDIMIGKGVVNNLPPARRGTAMMFQSYALFPHLDCTDNVAFSLKMKGGDKAAPVWPVSDRSSWPGSYVPVIDSTHAALQEAGMAAKSPDAHVRRHDPAVPPVPSVGLSSALAVRISGTATR